MSGLHDPGGTTPSISGPDAVALPPTPLRRIAAPLRQELIANLREAIIAGEYAPGERLVEKQLCTRYGVSRTVVREALRFLEAENLVTVVSNFGPVVRAMTPDEAVAVYEVRAALEGLATTLFARKASDEERARLTEATAALGAKFQSPNPADWVAAKDDYYIALLDGAHNEVLRDALLSLQSRVRTLRRLSLGAAGRMPQTIEEIRRITELAVAGDAEAAGRAAREHVETAAEVAMQRLAADGMG